MGEVLLGKQQELEVEARKDDEVVVETAVILPPLKQTVPKVKQPIPKILALLSTNGTTEHQLQISPPHTIQKEAQPKAGVKKNEKKGARKRGMSMKGVWKNGRINWGNGGQSCWRTLK
eukprot:4415903-Ditylum_brightwellii.AAC.1